MGPSGQELRLNFLLLMHSGVGILIFLSGPVGKQVSVSSDMGESLSRAHLGGAESTEGDTDSLVTM